MAIKRILIVVLLLIPFLLTSCAKEGVVKIAAEKTESAAGVSEAASDGNALNFRITWKEYSGRGEAIKKIVDSYNEENADGKDMKMIGGDEDIAAIEEILASGSNTICVLPYRYVQYFSEKAYLCDLTSAFQDAEAFFYPEVWKLGTVDSKTYGIPWLGHSMCLLYNKNLLEQAGVEPASITSLETLTDALKKVEEKTDAKGIGLVGAEGNDVSWMVNQFIYGFGSSLVNEDGTAVMVNNDKAKAALEYYRDVLGKYAQTTWVDDTGEQVMAAFRNQEVAFEIQGIWGVTDIQKNGSPFDVGILPMKAIGMRAEIGPMMLVVPSGMSDDMKEEAINFIRYMISTDAQEKILNGEYSPEHDTYYPFRTPIRMDMAESSIMKSNPDYMTFIEGFSNPSIDVPTPAWQTIKDKLYGPGLHQVMKGEMTIEKFLETVETEGNKILTAQ